MMWSILTCIFCFMPTGVVAVYNAHKVRSNILLTLCILMHYSFWFDKNKLGIVHCTYLEVSGYNFKNTLIVFFV